MLTDAVLFVFNRPEYILKRADLCRVVVQAALQTVAPGIPVVDVASRSMETSTGSAQASILHPQDSASRSPRILTIDDSPTYLALLCDELRNLDYDVECVASGQEGLGKLEHQNFDCVLVGLVMPGMDGIEVCRRITAMRSTRDRAPAVIILTDNEQHADMNRGFEAGADDFVSKSSDLAVLRARIQALMRRRFFQEENARIVEELKARELETLNARAGRHVAEARAAMA